MRGNLLLILQMKIQLTQKAPLIMTLHEIETRLSAAGVDSPRFDALELIVHFENISRATALVGGDFQSLALQDAVERRCRREPLAYILGQWDFMGHTFDLSPDCLIPRSDTELLCALLVRELPDGGRFADLCTGSGCIAIAALLARTDAQGVGVELYPDTLKVARKNARRHGVDTRLELLQGDVCTMELSGTFDWIVSNPPYVTKAEMDDLSPEVLLEPAHALTDGGDGLAFYRNIFARYPKYLKPGGFLAVEIGWQQGKAVCSIALAAGLSPVILQDLEGRDRVVMCK